MSDATALLHPLAIAVDWALLHSVWQYALLALGLGCLLAVFRRGPTDLRHNLAYLTLTLMSVIFITTLHAYHNAFSLTSIAPPSLAAGSYLPGTTQNLTSLRPLEPLIPWLAILWGFGVTLVTLHLLGGWHDLTRLSIHAQPAPALWQARLLELSARLQVYIPTHLLESTRIEVPTVIGWLRSVILVPPRAMIGLTTAQLELTLAHELMHVRRHDYLLNLLQNVVEVLFFYHPAVWWVSRQVRTEREHCCDDAVVEVFGSALAYARALAVLEGTRSERPQLALAASGGVLMNRVRRLINKPERSSATAGLFGVVMLLLGGVILAACTSGTAGTNASMVRLAGQEVCLRAEVYAGDHVIPAFSTASVNAMRRAARGTELVLAETCDASNLQLAYRMTFNARTLTWQAELQALTTSGEVAWHGSEAAGIRQEGAFQYLTESNAERLLVRFASDWATRH